MARWWCSIALWGACALLAGACTSVGDVSVRSATPIDSADALGPTPPTTQDRPTTQGGPSPTTVLPEPAETTTTVVREPVETAPTSTPVNPVIIERQMFASIPIGEVIEVGSSKPERDHDEFVAVAFADIERWWDEVFEGVYRFAFEPLQGSVYAGYPERTEEIPGCGDPGPTTYEDLQLFVAFYCPIGDFIAYDDGDDPDPEFGSLLVPLADAFGPAVIGVVLAHEYGHAIQERTGALDRPLPTILTEQQADCFAGAWTGQAYRGQSGLLRLGDTDIRAGLLALLEVRDPVGTHQFDPGGHGSAFDRVGAFQVGFLHGPARCSELLDDPLPLMPHAFVPGSFDERREGNAPYDCGLLDPELYSPEEIELCRDAPEFLTEDVNNFWHFEFEGVWDDFIVRVRVTASHDPAVCPSAVEMTPQMILCPDQRVVVYDEPQVLELYDDFGDFTLGYLLGIAAAELAQRQLGSPLAGKARALLNDCFTGAWVRDITPDQFGNTPRGDDLTGDGEPESTVRSSPGDLDEAIRMAILLGDLGPNVDLVGSAFEKIHALRTGVLGGSDACRAEWLP